MEWRIFFIGSMQQRGTSADHFSQMVEAVAAELEEHDYRAAEEGTYHLSGGMPVNSITLTRESDRDQITLIKPHDLYESASIPDNVFDAIDDADLVIADLSGLRPTVVYELAFAHALGIWTFA